MGSCGSSSWDDSSSDEEFDLAEEEDIALLIALHKRKKPKHDGSVFGHEYTRREWVETHKRLMHNFFGTPPGFFQRGIFIDVSECPRICLCTFMLGHGTKQKVTAALCMMAYGVPDDYIDGNLAMTESTSIFYIKQFAKSMVEVFGLEYLRSPNA